MHTTPASRIGQQFNRLTITGLVTRHGRTYYQCMCTCGAEKAVKCSHVTGGRTRSCGCLSLERRRAQKGRVSPLIKPDSYSAKYRVYKSYEKHALERKHVFELSLEQFVTLAGQDCTYCGASPGNQTWARQSRVRFIYNGVDIVDNTVGYILTNCVPCCKLCNTAKSNLTKEQFLTWAARLYTTSIAGNTKCLIST